MDSDTELYQYIKKTGIQGTRIVGDKIVAPLFWGDKPLNEGPIYFGAITILLFLIGLIITKKETRWLLISVTILCLFISWGRHLDWFNKLLYDYLPFFNKFRAPSLILGILGIFIVWGAMEALQIISNTNDRTDLKQVLKIPAVILIMTCLIVIFGVPAFSTFEWNYGLEKFGFGMDQQIFQLITQSGVMPDKAHSFLEALRNDREDYMIRDAWRTLGFVAFGIIVLYLFFVDKINKYAFIAILAVVLGFDIWTVSKRYVNDGHFVYQDSYEQLINYTQADKRIDELKQPHDRVLDLTTSVFLDSRPSYYHASIGGNNAAKLRRYDDLINYYLQPECDAIKQKNNNVNTPALNMLNTRFIKTGSGEKDYLNNLTSNGMAWFPNEIIWANTAREELEGIANLERTKNVIIHKEFKDYLADYRQDSNDYAKVELLTYLPGKITYKTYCSTERLIVFSEIWFKGDEYWKVKIDDEPATHIRANYALRAMKVPVGEHTISFEFVPKPFIVGEKIAFAGSTALVLAIFGAILALGYQENKKSLKA